MCSNSEKAYNCRLNHWFAFSMHFSPRHTKLISRRLEDNSIVTIIYNKLSHAFTLLKRLLCSPLTRHEPAKSAAIRRDQLLPEQPLRPLRLSTGSGACMRVA